VPERDEAPDPFVEAIAEELRAAVSLRSSVGERVMTIVRADARRRRRWEIAGRMLAAAVVVIAAVVGGIMVRARLYAPDTSVGTLVRFVLPASTAAAARQVVVVGDFNHWDTHATPLRRTAKGIWQATVRLTPGAHVYSFVVDGSRWVPDPSAPVAPGSDFGSPNSLVTVAPGAT
jgi:Glycogen recognition site of AMP-activated protein kinase